MVETAYFVFHVKEFSNEIINFFLSFHFIISNRYSVTFPWAFTQKLFDSELNNEIIQKNLSQVAIIQDKSFLTQNMI